MKLQSLFSIALRALWRNKSRSVLTTLGVIIGVGAVIMLIAIGSGLQALVVEQFEDFGANNIFIVPGEIEGGFSEDQVIASANNIIRYQEVTAIRKLRDYVTLASPLSLNISKTVYKENDQQTSIVGIDSEYFDITNTNAAKGSVFTAAQTGKKDKVAVLGSNIAGELFGQVDPVNKTIQVNNQRFRIVGVAEAKGGGFGGPSLDDYVYIPFPVWADLYDSDKVFRIIAKIGSEDLIEPAKIAITEELLKTLDDDEFSVTDQTDLLAIINQILGGLTAGLGGIAAISLVVGGIGIMNIMLVSVTERTREIGLRKALGATPYVIMVQFLIESVVLSVMGGLIGVGIAFVGSLAISQFIPAKVTPMAVLLAFGVSAVVGIVFGVYPARKASKLSPIEALRYE
jgi:putative ABC transport system permease protein